MILFLCTKAMIVIAIIIISTIIYTILLIMYNNDSKRYNHEELDRLENEDRKRISIMLDKKWKEGEAKRLLEKWKI